MKCGNVLYFTRISLTFEGMTISELIDMATSQFSSYFIGFLFLMPLLQERIILWYFEKALDGWTKNQSRNEYGIRKFYSMYVHKYTCQFGDEYFHEITSQKKLVRKSEEKHYTSLCDIHIARNLHKYLYL